MTHRKCLIYGRSANPMRRARGRPAIEHPFYTPSMTKSWADGLPIRVEAVDAQGVPASFGWQGQTHAVERLVQRWEVETDWWSEEGETRRLFVTVITKTGMLCVLFCDLPTGEWRISRLYD